MCYMLQGASVSLPDRFLISGCSWHADNQCSTNVPTRPIVEEFAASNQAFYDSFLGAWVKMQELGVEGSLQSVIQDCSIPSVNNSTESISIPEIPDRPTVVPASTTFWETPVIIGFAVGGGVLLAAGALLSYLYIKRQGVATGTALAAQGAMISTATPNKPSSAWDAQDVESS